MSNRRTFTAIIGDVCAQLGIDPPTGDPIGSTDKTIKQLVALANVVGRRLAADAYQWEFLKKTFTITTVIGQASYNLPDDFNGFVPDASWNQTTRLPVIGGLEEFEWQMLKARLTSGTTFTALYRLTTNAGAATQGSLEFYNTPSSIQTVVLPYNSNAWAYLNAGTFNVYSTIDAAAGLTPMFDAQLFETCIKLEFYKVKGFDTTNLRGDYTRDYANAKAADKAGRTLSLAKGSDYPYLGVINLPDTGYGV